jgi:Golgi SNAP receptor complex protein 2
MNGQRRPWKKEHEAISMDGYMSQEQDKILQSHREIDDMLAQGSETLLSLRNQREMLKSTRTKVLDIVNTLGMSNTVMRFIEKRSSKDKVILFGGMIAFTIFMFLVWRYIL